MPKLKLQNGEAGALTASQEMLLLYGRDLLCGWQQSLERAAWLQTAEARAAWRKHRARLIREWLQGLPRDLPVASRLYDSKRQQAELEALMASKWAKCERRKAAPPRPADAGARKAGFVQ
jgi:hypothetical protein